MVRKNFISLTSPEVKEQLSRRFRSHPGEPHDSLIEEGATNHRGRCLVCGVYLILENETRTRRVESKCVKVRRRGRHKKEAFVDVTPSTTFEQLLWVVHRRRGVVYLYGSAIEENQNIFTQVESGVVIEVRRTKRPPDEGKQR